MKLIALCVVAGVMALLWWFKVPANFGAHPFFAANVVLIGGGIGVVAALALFRLQGGLRIALFAALLLGGYFTAQYGKERFAISFGDDAFAGKLWHYGWHTAMAGLGGVLVTLALMLPGRRDT